MLILWIEYAYELRADAWCAPKSDKIFLTLYDAKRQCNDDASCTMLYDASGAGTKFILCGKGAQVKISTKGAILHIKISECICSSFVLLETILFFTQLIKGGTSVQILEFRYPSWLSMEWLANWKMLTVMWRRNKNQN